MRASSPWQNMQAIKSPAKKTDAASFRSSDGISQAIAGTASAIAAT